MSLLRLRPVVAQVTRIAHSVQFTRTVVPQRFVSGYGGNRNDSQTPIDPMQAGKAPEYSGPSIAEKQKGGPISDLNEQGQKMKKKRDAEFADNLYEQPKELSNDGSAEFDGQIRQPRPDLGNKKGKNLPNITGQDQDFAGNQKKGSKLSSTDSNQLGQSKRRMSTGSSITEDLMDDARRIKDHTKNKMTKGALAAAGVGVDLQEGAQSVLHKAKKTVRAVKESVKDAAAGIIDPLVSGDRPLESTRSNEELYPVSDVSGAREGFKVGNVKPEVAAKRSAESMGEDVNSIRKSMFDGPQDMPQGVGKRAADAQGKPMETGVRGS